VIDLYQCWQAAPEDSEDRPILYAAFEYARAAYLRGLPVNEPE
jgi:hypothetical protein